MKIAIASSGLGHVARGIETWALTLAQALAGRGVVVTLFAAAAAEDEGQRRERSSSDAMRHLWRASRHAPCALPLPVRVLTCLRRGNPTARQLATLFPAFTWRWGMTSTYGWEQLSFWWHLWPILRKEKFDILHVQDPMLADWCRRFRKLGLVKTREILAHGTEEPPEFLARFEYVQHLAPWHGAQRATSEEQGAWRREHGAERRAHGAERRAQGEEKQSAERRAHGEANNQAVGSSAAMRHLWRAARHAPCAMPPPAAMRHLWRAARHAPCALPSSRASRPDWFVIPNFVDTAVFRPVEDQNEKARIRERLGIPADAFVVGCVAAIKKGHKRVDYLIREFAEVRGRRTEGGGQRTEDGGQRTEDGGQRTEDGGQRTEDGGQRTEGGGLRSESSLRQGHPPSSGLRLTRMAEEGERGLFHAPCPMPHAALPFLLIAGARTEETDELVRLAGELAPGCVRIMPDLPRGAMPDLYRAMDVFALCSLFEMMPIAVLEAMASGLPVVANRHPVLEWMVGGGGEQGAEKRQGAERMAHGAERREQGAESREGRAEGKEHGAQRATSAAQRATSGEEDDTERSSSDAMPYAPCSLRVARSSSDAMPHAPCPMRVERSSSDAMPHLWRAARHAPCSLRVARSSSDAMRHALCAMPPPSATGGSCIDMTQAGELAAEIGRYAADGMLRGQRGAAARERAERMFSKDVVVGQIVGMYEEVLG